MLLPSAIHEAELEELAADNAARHDWIAEEGSFVYEPPGEIHTLTVPGDCPEMITFFNIGGAMVYLDEAGRQTGYEDVWTKIDLCRKHYAASGLTANYVEQFIR